MHVEPGNYSRLERAVALVTWPELVLLLLLAANGALHRARATTRRTLGMQPIHVGALALLLLLTDTREHGDVT